jgi:ATP-binding cassette subfamily C protein
MRVFLYFARAYPLQSVVVLACLILGGTLEGVGLSAVLPLISVAIEGAEPSKAPTAYEARVLDVLTRCGIPRTLEALGVLVIGLFVAKAILVVIANRQVGYAVARVATDLRLRLLRALLGASWSYNTRQPVGAAVNSMATEAYRGSQTYYSLGQVLQDGSEAVVAVGVALAVSWQATLAAVAAGAASVFVLGGLVRMTSRAGAKQTSALRSLLARLSDVLGAVKLLKATAREPLLGPLIEKDTERLNRALRRQVVSKEALRALQEPITVALCVLGLVASVRVLALPFSELLLVLGLFARTISNVSKMQRKYQLMVTDESALWSIVAMIEDAESQREEAGGGTEPHLHRGLELRDVSVEYEGRAVFDKLSLEIPAGSITAIIGPSGAGKTTIVDLLTGLVRPSGGEVRIDGVPLAEIDLRSWRSMIGYVPQEMLLLNDSVRANVTLGDPSLDDAEVEQALRDAEAWEYVSRHPEGLAASVGERGLLLSGGQRQRIAIARALVHRPRLLILDEATAALDPAIETAIWATVSHLRGKTTVVAISHQPALVGVADRVYRIDHGTAQRVDRLAAAPTASEGAG